MKNLIILISLLFLFGCNEVEVEEVKTVEWYKANKDEMLSKIEECSDRPDLMEKSENCKNANAAMLLEISSKPATNW